MILFYSQRLYFVAGGGFNGNLDDIGNDGNFWSPIPNGSDDARNANFNVDGNANPSNNDNRNNGNSIRCVLRPVVNAESDDGGGEGPGPKKN